VKPLFFHAVAGHPKVASALLKQASAALRPFQQYLRQAVHTARARQVRYQLPWERVHDPVTVRLDALDTVLAVPRRPPGMRLTPWPSGAEADPSKPAFVVERSEVVTLEPVRLTPEGLLVQSTPALLPQDHLIWCGQHCTVELEPPSRGPRVVTTLDGQALQVRGITETEDDRHWRVCVEGRIECEQLLVDGEPVEVRRDHDGPRRLVDASGAGFEARGMQLNTEPLPAEGPLHGDDGARYHWSIDGGGEGRRGSWVRLLPPDDAETDEFLDPRAAFCEGDVREVWTEAHHRTDSIIAVRRVDADRYQLLLERLPPEGSSLYLPVDVRSLQLQRRALSQLSEAPLPHHQGLLRLCEDPERVRWPAVASVALDDPRWRSLTDSTRSGTDQQRRFVEKALGSPDLALLEGPPGSGKTTAICELIQQLVEQGQRVLLCASTHVAIDNVLERLLASRSPIDAVRIGRLAQVDDEVRGTQLDARVEALVERWRQAPAMRRYAGELKEMAERTIIMAANLTCGTTMGIVNHPLFRGRNSTMPHWDVLIVDEASKTLIQEFLVPALMARRWIIVGDVRQLPPFTDRAAIVANLRDLVDQDDRPSFPRDHQRACLLLFRLLRGRVRQPGMRWLLVEPPGLLDWIERELEAEPAEGLSVVRVVPKLRPRTGQVHLVAVDRLDAGAPEALHLAAADWVLVEDDLLPRVSSQLPSSVLLSTDPTAGPHGRPESDPLFFRQAYWLTRAERLPRPYRDERSRRGDVTTLEDGQANETAWLSRHDLAQELAWRLTRVHELRHGRNQRERDRLDRDLRHLRPRATDISEALSELEDIGLPSILEVLQEGIGEERSQRRSALTLGLRHGNARPFEARFESLTHQHRMHPELSAFPREAIYGATALHDANTITQRDATIGWTFDRFPTRSAWVDVVGREQRGVNRDELAAVEAVLGTVVEWAASAGPPARNDPPRWQIACLSFYAKQDREMAQLLQRVAGSRDRGTRFTMRGVPLELVCGTVDRFQGREADLVVLSMRNTRRIGFLDSPNRLNVAVTRARQQLVVVGNARYFERCGVWELEQLVRRSSVVPPPASHPRRAR